MNRVIFSIVLFLTALPGFATEWYVGGMLGNSHLNYDIEKEAYSAIVNDPENAQYAGLLYGLGGTLQVSTNQDAGYQKMFVGAKFNDFWGVELFSFRTDAYTASALATLDAHPSASGGSYQLNAQGEISAKYEATADFTGYGVRVNGFAPVTPTFDIMIGLGLMKTTVSIVDHYIVDGSYNYNGSAYTGNYGVATSGSGAEHTEENGTNRLSTWAPIVSLGVLYQLHDHIAFRVEIERLGNPIDNSSIDTASAGLQFIF